MRDRHLSSCLDQARDLRRAGVAASIMSTAAGEIEKDLATERDLATSRLLFTSPKAILATTWRKAIQAPDVSSRIVAVAIDEAHCVWKW